MIGLLDSGVGGLSVWRELYRLMPDEEYWYIADSGYCPYGPRPVSEVTDRVRRISRFLIENGAELIVVACNTATAAAIATLRAEFPVPFVGMEPAVKPAALRSKTGAIGVLATQGTFRGDLYLKTLHRFASETQVVEQVGTGLVELVEQGKEGGREAEVLLRKYIGPMLERNADHLVLGCTHYPFLIEPIRRITNGLMQIVDPAPAVAERARDILLQIRRDSPVPAAVSGKKIDTFITTGNNIELMKKMVAEIVYGKGAVLPPGDARLFYSKGI